MVLRKLGRSPRTLEPLELFRRLDEAPHGTRIGEGARIEAVMSQARDGLQAALSNESTLHGWRAQSMFESLVVALDGCELLMTVDHGQVFHDGDPVKPADLFVVLRDGRRLVIDVKAVPPGRMSGQHTMSAAEWHGLRRFGDLLNAEVYLAVLLPDIMSWTLVPLSTFPEPTGARSRVPITDLFAGTEMTLLGDRWIGIEPPIRMELLADRNAPRAVTEVNCDGGTLQTVDFVIGEVRYTIGERPLRGKQERQLANFLLMYGGWDVTDEVVIDDDGLLDRTVMTADPGDVDTRQNFQFVGALSSMYTRWFDVATRDPRLGRGHHGSRHARRAGHAAHDGAP